MTSLESIVLPLPESRALAEAWIALDTVAWWQRSLAHIDHPMSVHIKGDNSELGIEDFFEDVCPAPTLSELLDAIRKRVDELITKSGRNLELSRTELDDAIYWEVIGRGKNDCEDDWQQAVGNGSTDLLAAAALLREVSK